jgi:hypothetical protein
LSDPDLPYLEGGRPAFSLRLKLVSSVYTQDVNLNTFFRAAHNPNIEDKQLVEVSEDTDYAVDY